MGRPVITTTDIDKAVAAGQKQVRVPANAIITQLAREYAQSREIQLVEGLPVEGSQVIGAATAPQHAEVRAAVLAKLGTEPGGLDAAIAKVLGGQA